MKVGTIIDGISTDIDIICKVMNETGVKYAEFQSCNGKRIEENTVEDAKLFKSVADKHGIIPCCVTTHAFAGIPIGSLEVGDETYNKQMELLKNGIAIARVLKAPYVRSMTFTKAIVTWGYHGSEKWNAGGNQSWGKFLKLFEPIAQLAEDEGIDILVETCFNSMNTSAYLTKKMIEDLGAKRIKLLWDPCNALYWHEYPTVELYESIRDILGHIHIKDGKVDCVKAEVDFRPIGRGMLAPYLSDLADALRRDNYQGCITLENVLKPDGKDFIDGYYTDIPELIKIFG